jgi:chemotaxis protein MotB
MRRIRRNDELTVFHGVACIAMLVFALYGLEGCASRQESRSEVRPATPLSAKDRQSQSWSGIYDQITRRLQSEIKSNKAEVKQFENQVRITISNDVLFPGGGWTIDRKGNELLDKIIPVFKDFKNQAIEVYGYTDNAPAGSLPKSKFSTNRELSLARAVDIVGYFQNKGINRDLLSATGYGAEEPVATNDIPKGRAKNRRMVIAVMSPDSS